MPSPFMQDIQEGARRGANAGWGGTPGEEPALTAKVFPTGGSPGGNRGDSDWRLVRREQGQARLANHAILLVASSVRLVR